MEIEQIARQLRRALEAWGKSARQPSDHVFFDLKSRAETAKGRTRDAFGVNLLCDLQGLIDACKTEADDVWARTHRTVSAKFIREHIAQIRTTEEFTRVWMRTLRTRAEDVGIKFDAIL
ncbi:hypothetical protein [Bordetella sp. 15P40C-2]|uniref:hypothetical protein n=1 Tax=Bordetella sp. 15P40C-2 TaxID=2572246 RepID=UPI001324F2A9|nr:hypothetical protein [Bordetella sp. 15P40C-2]MVW72169.1 hypothetical protein [Bordetella sp. 15P40C-2]